jgi:cell division control protein 24
MNGGAPKQLTRRQHILKELVETERQYVHHLLNLQALKKELEECGALTGDSIHSIFLNLNNLLDFAQRFLIRIEQHNELPEKAQNWGDLFIHYKEPFRQYEPFIANQLRCETTCQKEWDKMKKVGRSPLMDQMLADPTILSGFLLKPFQRLTKYPLLLKVGPYASKLGLSPADPSQDLSTQTDDENLQADLSDAVEIIQGVLQEANAAIDKETRQNALVDLKERVEEWKSLKVETFGELMLFGTFTVLKGDGGSKDQEKEVCFTQFIGLLTSC